ncbi:MAG: elongation factor Ts [Dehalococcoidia bacterium]|nr:elongation factor Ts [Dehalococcoidia bacterium]
MVTTADVRRLREETGAGVMDAKRALEEAAGDFDRARSLLRERGIAAASKRSQRATSQGVVEAYIHGEGRIGALVEVNCETDFVARTDAFRQLARDVAMQVAAMNPASLLPEDVPEALDGEKEQHALLTQAFIKDASRTIRDLIQDVSAQTGEHVRISHFARFELGT